MTVNSSNKLLITTRMSIKMYFNMPIEFQSSTELTLLTKYAKQTRNLSPLWINPHIYAMYCTM